MPRPKSTRELQRKTYRTKLADSRRAWTQLGGLGMVLRVYDSFGKGEDDDDLIIEDGDDQAEGGASVSLVLHRHGWRTPMRISLTSFTEQELRAMRELFNMAVTTALPIVRERDLRTRRAYEVDGVTSLYRLYRVIPRLFLRQGAEYRNSTIVRSGLDWPAELGEFPITDAEQELRDTIGYVPKREPVEASPRDYVSEASDLPYVRPLGWAAEYAAGVQAPEGIEAPAEAPAEEDAGGETDDRVQLDKRGEGTVYPAKPPRPPGF